MYSGLVVAVAFVTTERHLTAYLMIQWNIQNTKLQSQKGYTVERLESKDVLEHVKWKTLHYHYKLCWL